MPDRFLVTGAVVSRSWGPNLRGHVSTVMSPLPLSKAPALEEVSSMGARHFSFFHCGKGVFMGSVVDSSSLEGLVCSLADSQVGLDLVDVCGRMGRVFCFVEGFCV